MPFYDKRIWIKEVKSPETYYRFFHRDVTGGTSRNIKRVPFNWSGFGRYRGLAFFHCIATIEDELLYTVNNPVAHVQGVKLGHFWYDSYIKKIVDLTNRKTFMELIGKTKLESNE